MMCKYTGMVCICADFCQLQALEESWNMETTAERLASLIKHYVHETPGNWKEKLEELRKHVDENTLDEFASWMD